jgi:hypothetical protein
MTKILKQETRTTLRCQKWHLSPLVMSPKLTWGL